MTPEELTHTIKTCFLIAQEMGYHMDLCFEDNNLKDIVIFDPNKTDNSEKGR